MKYLVGDKDKHQWFTPVWAAEILFETHFSDLTSSDIVLEPTCGTGSFLKAIPDHIPAYGIELDPELAEIARASTGRMIINGDITTVNFPANPTAVIGNPPFEMDLIDQMLNRCHDALPDNGRLGLILPAYAFQTASRLVRYKSKWSLYQEMIPRNLFPGMMKPICFAIFKKDRLGKLFGFSLYEELNDINQLEKGRVKQLSTQKAPWKTMVMNVIKELGGQASLEDIYKAIEPRRPPTNNWWREKVRQTLGRHKDFLRVGQAEWSLAS